MKKYFFLLNAINRYLSFGKEKTEIAHHDIKRNARLGKISERNLLRKIKNKLLNHFDLR